MRKIASSPTIEGAEKLLNQYFCSTSYKISEDLIISNNKGIFEKVIIKKIKGRYVIYEK
jgi:hypothetical protein